MGESLIRVRRCVYPHKDLRNRLDLQYEERGAGGNMQKLYADDVSVDIAVEIGNPELSDLLALLKIHQIVGAHCSIGRTSVNRNQEGAES